MARNALWSTAELNWTACRIGADDGPLPAVYLASGTGVADELAEIRQALEPSLQSEQLRSFLLIGVSMPDWHRSYSPWAAPALSAKGEPFAGCGAKTLGLIEAQLIPEVVRRYGAGGEPESRALIGYSLAGLFALWALYVGAGFGHYASCSGSLWFDGWDAFTAEHIPRPHSRVYLSLGRREERARNHRMSAVGEATRRTAARLAGDPGLTESLLEWHDGGHFTQIPQRVARGIAWLMRAESREQSQPQRGVPTAKSPGR